MGARVLGNVIFVVKKCRERKKFDNHFAKEQKRELTQSRIISPAQIHHHLELLAPPWQYLWTDGCESFEVSEWPVTTQEWGVLKNVIWSKETRNKRKLKENYGRKTISIHVYSWRAGWSVIFVITAA